MKKTTLVKLDDIGLFFNEYFKEQIVNSEATELGCDWNVQWNWGIQTLSCLLTFYI